MKRTAWKWIFGVSLMLLILLTLFTVSIWALGNATAAMAGGIMGYIDPDNFGYRYLSFDDFIIGAVGSPIFYCCVTDLVVLLGSIVGLIATRKTNR